MKNQLKFSCREFSKSGTSRPKSWDIPAGHSLSKTTENGYLHKVFVRDIQTSGSLMSQEYPAPKLLPDLTRGSNVRALPN